MLYRLTETKAPTNYNLDSTPKYLFFYEKDANPKEAFKTALGDTPIKDIDNNKNVTVDDVIFGCSTNTTQLTVKNTYNRLTVQKYWLNASNNQTANEADIPQKSIRVQLYRHKAGQPPEAYEAYGTPVELSKTNNWSHTWEGTAIPAKDEKGEDWFYSVKELDTGLWKPPIALTMIPTSRKAAFISPTPFIRPTSCPPLAAWARCPLRRWAVC